AACLAGRRRLVAVRWFRNLALGLAATTLAACGGSPGRAGPPPSAAWAVYRHLPGVVGLAGARGGGAVLVAAAGRLLGLGRGDGWCRGPAAGRLLVLGGGGGLRPSAGGAGGYLTAMGTEPYLVLARSDAGRGDPLLVRRRCGLRHRAGGTAGYRHDQPAGPGA